MTLNRWNGEGGSEGDHTQKFITIRDVQEIIIISHNLYCVGRRSETVFGSS
jgi:hypothetical protein